MTGKALKTALGLDKFTWVYIQKILGISIPIFIVTVDSRRPNIFLSITRVRRTNVTTIQKAQVIGIQSLAMKNYTFTIPVRIETTNPIINTGSIIIRRDIGGEYWLNNKMFESVNNKKIEVISI